MFKYEIWWNEQVNTRKNTIVIAINLIIISLLTGAFCLYRTIWPAPYMLSVILPILLLPAFITTVLATLVYFSIRRRQRALRGIEANLEQITHREDTSEALKDLEAVPVGASTPDSHRGWNRLLGILDEVSGQTQNSPCENTMGQFLCSYDSQRLLGLFDSLPDGIILTDSTGSLTLANRACEGLIGRPLGDIIGCSLVDIFDDPQAKKSLESLLDTSSPQADSYFNVTTGSESEKSILSVYCRRLAHISDKGDILVNIRDVTQQKIGEAGRDEFIAHVSHELRSPLTNIRAYAETLLADMLLDANAQKEAFNVINDETSRLIRLVNDILDLSRMETGSLNLEKGEVVLDRLVRQCVNDVKASAAAKKISLQTNYHPKLPNLNADREKLAVVLNNIISNAIKYTPEGGTVFIETNVDDNFVLIKVADTGLGIGPEDIDKTFKRANSFFDGELAVHVDFAYPFCQRLRELLLSAAEQVDTNVHDSGTYICMEGPQFSTRAESMLHRSWGAHLIGMTCMPEAKLAREAEICYALVALPTDYDCWKPHEGDQNKHALMKEIIGNLNTATKNAIALIRAALAQAGTLLESECEHHQALELGIWSDKIAVTNPTFYKLQMLIGKYFP